MHKRDLEQAFHARGLRLDHVGVRYSSAGLILVASGKLPDGTPFTYTGKPSFDDMIERAKVAANEIVKGPPTPTYEAIRQAQAAIEQQQGTRPMGKLETVADRMKGLKVKLEGRADSLRSSVRRPRGHRGPEPLRSRRYGAHAGADHEQRRARQVSGARLDQFSKEEWRDVARKVRPDWTEEDFDRAWDEFVAMKKAKALQ